MNVCEPSVGNTSKRKKERENCYALDALGIWLLALVSIILDCADHFLVRERAPLVQQEREGMGISIRMERLRVGLSTRPFLNRLNRTRWRCCDDAMAGKQPLYIQVVHVLF